MQLLQKSGCGKQENPGFPRKLDNLNLEKETRQKEPSFRTEESKRAVGRMSINHTVSSKQKTNIFSGNKTVIPNWKWGEPETKENANTMGIPFSILPMTYSLILLHPYYPCCFY
jgi:hypothetical protein